MTSGPFEKCFLRGMFRINGEKEWITFFSKILQQTHTLSISFYGMSYPIEPVYLNYIEPICEARFIFRIS